MSWDQLLDPGVVVRHSPVETDRFGCTIDRITIGPGSVDVDQLLAVIHDLSAEVLIVRYDAARLELPSTFTRSHRAVVPAGTLTYWEQLVSVAEPPAPSDLDVLPADTHDLERVTALVREIVRSSFRDYGNHYTANPLLDSSAALSGYQDWAVRSLNEDPGNVLIMTDRGEPIGLATLEWGADARHLEILLAGLVPTAQGKRLYGSLLDACERVAAGRGAGRMVISTQVHNVRVQRAWARHGLRPFAAIETVHLIDRDLFNSSRRQDDNVASDVWSLNELINKGWTPPPTNASGVRICKASDGSDVSPLEAGPDVTGLERGDGFCIGRRFDLLSGFGIDQGGSRG